MTLFPLVYDADTQQTICVGPYCECAGTEEECGCFKIGADGKYDTGATHCSNCGAILKVIDLETGEDV